jgi:cellulose synthase/poly-beta-1,6-N-acetylglucosamine synthase-like glycosyltransferase
MWAAYVQIYVVLALLYLWYRFGLLFYADLRKPRLRRTYGGERISVLVPFYNEKQEILRAAIESLLAARGNTEVIVVDDGSPRRGAVRMVRRTFAGRVKLVRCWRNRGKREAQAEGLRYATGDFVVAVDSDSIVEPDALVNLVEPLLADPSIGATTGNVRVLNQKQNLLTRMIAARYWNACGMERRSLSRAGVVTCCSGVLSAYRAPLMRAFMPAYLQQRFLGETCTYGDDRHLTNLILREGYKTVYVHEAVCHTEVPSSFRQFLRQQLRWKKSFLRESYVSLTFAFRHSFLLPFEVLLNLVLPFVSIAIRIAVIVGMILEPRFIPIFVVSVAVVALLRNFFLLFEERRFVPYAILYAYVHEFALFWLYFVALFKLRERGWGTR